MTPATAASPLVMRLRTELLTRLAPYLEDATTWDLIDFPDYFNCGDSAIWLGQLAVGRHFGLSLHGLASYKTYDPDRLQGQHAIALAGGGNFGGLYPPHHRLRLQVLRDFPDRQILQLPQSVEFTSNEYSEELKRAIGEHRHFTLFVRDVRSFERATAALDCDVQLVPDIAFGIGGMTRAAPEEDVVTQARTDGERGETSLPPRWPSFDWLEADSSSARSRAQRLARRVERLRSRLPEAAFREIEKRSWNRFARLNVDHAVKELSRGRTLLTDRLHGHVMAELLQIPHIVVDDRFGKIRALWDTWTPDTHSAQLVRTWPEAVEAYRGGGPTA